MVDRKLLVVDENPDRERGTDVEDNITHNRSLHDGKVAAEQHGAGDDGGDEDATAEETREDEARLRLRNATDRRENVGRSIAKGEKGGAGNVIGHAKSLRHGQQRRTHATTDKGYELRSETFQWHCQLTNHRPQD